MNTQVKVMTPLEIIVKAREILSDPRKWFQGFYTADKEGNKVYSENAHKAYSFCMIGALREAAGGNWQYDANGKTLREINRASYFAAHHKVELSLPKDNPKLRWIANFNDDENTTHSMVLSVFDKAIESLEKENGTA